MLNPLESILTYFPTGTAEGDRNILEKVFVYADEFAKVVAPPPGSPHILVGSKGSGKTAVLEFSRALFDRAKIPSILLTPFNIDTSRISPEYSTGDLTREFYFSILEAIVQELSRSSSGLLGGDERTLYNYAVNSGLRDPGMLGNAIQFLSSLATAFSGVQLHEVIQKLQKLSSPSIPKVSEALQRIVDKKSFYLFIDDTDQIGRPGEAGHLNRVWALLLAGRKLAYDINNLKVVISLRTEVWLRLQRDDYGQRDQTDHFRSLVVMMRNSREHVGHVIDRRLSLAAAQAKAPVDGWQYFFEGASARAPMSNDNRLWRDLILVRTRERPRDAIQLVNQLARRAIDQGKTRIDEQIFQSVIPQFSRAMSQQLAEELRPEFPEFLEHLRSLADANFSGGSFTMTAEEAKDHFTRMLSRHGATISGVRLNQTAPDSPFQIWRLFYEYGVLNARISDMTKKGGFNHLSPQDDPYIVLRARWNEMQGMLWEVNPSYRDFLIEVQAEKEKRSGLPSKPKRKPR
jgi:hypothetical protein